MSALSVQTVRAGHYIHAGTGRVRQVPKGHVGLYCELCDWSQTLARRAWPEARIEQLRAQHLGSAHFSALTSGAAVINPELRYLHRPTG